MSKSRKTGDIIIEVQDISEREGLTGLLRLADERPEECFAAMAVLLPGRFLKALARASNRSDSREGTN